MREFSTIVAALFRLKGEHSKPRLPLLLDGSEVKFLKEALRQGCRFWRLDVEAAAETEIWQLEFFIDTRFACSFLVIHKALDTLDFAQKPSPEQLGSSLFQQLAQALEIAPDAARLLDSGRMLLHMGSLEADGLIYASQFLRGTNSLTMAEFEERNSRKLAIDPRGMALFGKVKNIELIARRYVILLALLRAYQYAIDSAVDLLAALVAQPASLPASAELSALQRDSLVFAARFLFARPVRLDTVDLRYVWERLAQVHHLQESHQELTEQLSAVHALLLHDEEKREALREKRAQLWLALIGILLALISLLGLVEVTPDKLVAFWRAWQ
jgi:hypothetical protein